MSGEATAAQRDEGRRRIDAGNFQSICRHVARDWAARSAAEVEHGRAFGQRADKAVMPWLVIPRGAGAISVPGDRVPFVVTDDLVGELAHRERLAMRGAMLKRKPRPEAGVCL